MKTLIPLDEFLKGGSLAPEMLRLIRKMTREMYYKCKDLCIWYHVSQKTETCKNCETYKLIKEAKALIEKARGK